MKRVARQDPLDQLRRKLLTKCANPARADWHSDEPEGT